MPFDRPTLQNLYDRSDAEFDTRVDGIDMGILRGFTVACSRIFAGLIHLAYGALVLLAKALMPDTARGRFLERWLNIEVVTRRPSTYADGPASAAGNEGTNVPAFSVLTRSDGIEYQTDAAAVVTGGVAEFNITCKTKGVTGNLTSGAILNFSPPIGGMSSEAVVGVAGITGGFEVENDESARERMLEKKRHPPMAGDQFDYPAWLKEVVGITRAWVDTVTFLPGVVGVVFLMDEKTTNAEILRNGVFASVDNWETGPGWAVTGGKAHSDGTYPAESVLRQNIDPLGDGVPYELTFTISNRTAGSVRYETGPSGSGSGPISADGTYTYYFNGDPGSAYFQFVAEVGFIGDIDNVSLKDLGSTAVPSIDDIDDAYDYLRGHTGIITGAQEGMPVTAELVITRSNVVPLDYNIHLYTDTADIRQAIVDELTDLHYREARPNGTLLLTKIKTAINGAPGNTGFDLNSPVSDVVSNYNTIRSVGTVTFV